MIDYHRLGDVPVKNHITFHEGDKLLMEQCVTRRGFDGAYSILYFHIPPTDESAVEPMELPGFCPVSRVEKQLLHRRHIQTAKLPHQGDFLTARKTVLMNDDVHMGIVKTSRKPGDFFSNGDGDECWFAYDCGGRLDSLYGTLRYKKYDYVIIPKGTPYRIVPENDQATLLVIEGRGFIDIPTQWRNHRGQLTLDAPYSHRDFRRPTELITFEAATHGQPPYRHVIKMNDQLTVHLSDHWPWELKGWDGYSYPVAFNILDYQPRTGLIHLPPTIHLTFAGNDFIICSFVPRKVDYYDRDGAKSIPCPYGHANVDCDEVLYYVDGNFTSRKGIERESMSLHPMGVPHGPHPGTYEKSVGTDRTNELAVMCDTFKPLWLTTAAEQIEQKDYHMTWAKG